MAGRGFLPPRTNRNSAPTASAPQTMAQPNKSPSVTLAVQPESVAREAAVHGGESQGAAPGSIQVERGRGPTHGAAFGQDN